MAETCAKKLRSLMQLFGLMIAPLDRPLGQCIAYTSLVSVHCQEIYKYNALECRVPFPIFSIFIWPEKYLSLIVLPVGSFVGGGSSDSQ